MQQQQQQQQTTLSFKRMEKKGISLLLHALHDDENFHLSATCGVIKYDEGLSNTSLYSDDRKPMN